MAAGDKDFAGKVRQQRETAAELTYAEVIGYNRKSADARLVCRLTMLQRRKITDYVFCRNKEKGFTIIILWGKLFSKR